MKKLGLLIIILAALTINLFGQFDGPQELLLGEWEGTTTPKDGKPKQITFKFEKKDGKFVAEWSNGFDKKPTVFDKIDFASSTVGVSLKISDSKTPGRHFSGTFDPELFRIDGAFETKSGKDSNKEPLTAVKKGMGSSRAMLLFNEGNNFLRGAENSIKFPIATISQSDRLTSIKSDLTNAQKRFADAIAVDKSFAEAYAKRGKATRMLSPTNAVELKKALTDLDTAISLYPKVKGSFFERAVIKGGLMRITKTNDYDSIIADLNEELKLSPTIEVLLSRVAVYIQKGSYDLALKDVDTILVQQPNNSDASRLKKMIEAKPGVKP